MSPIIHGCVGWLIGHRSPSRRVRVTCTLAAVAPDLDGLGLLISDELYLAWHHRLAHGVGFAIATAAVATLVCRRERPLHTAVLALLAFHSHVLMDLAGSGPGWPILYWWPWSTTEWLPSWQWDLASWQNSAFGLAVILACLATSLTVARTPVELFSPRVDRLVVDTVVARFTTKPPPPSPHGDDDGDAASG